MAKHRLTAAEITSLDFGTLPQVQISDAMPVDAQTWIDIATTVPPAEAGVLFTLLMWAWRHKPPCSLPNDAATLRRLAGGTLSRPLPAALVASVAEQHFILCADGYLRNAWQVNAWLRLIKRRGYIVKALSVMAGARPDQREWLLLRRIVFERDGYRCIYCGSNQPPFHCDHVIPVSRGGSNDLTNLATACASCNLSKHDSTPEEWRPRSVGRPISASEFGPS